ncbi:MAG: hypothetical protein KKD92_03285 [Proteobacteria bacterium]|nr:hypothetical protein [Pseudomonadota bacterium]
MEFERWIRYLVPGSVAIAPLVFSAAFLPNKAMQTPMIVALVALGPGVGFFVHQLHMLFHELFYLPNKKCLVIKQILKRCESSRLLQNKSVTENQALLAWHYFFYDSKFAEKELHKYILRCWYFIHSFCSAGWGFLCGSIFLVVVLWLLNTFPFYLKPNKQAVFITIWAFFILTYLIGCILLLLKSFPTYKNVIRVEALAVHRHWRNIEIILLNIIQAKI